MPNNEKDDRYYLSISLGALRHLGIGLYSNIPAVVAELVANAWDADATVVDIRILEDEIVVQDDGYGMTLEDINTRFLKVGYDKRHDRLDSQTKIVNGVMCTTGRERPVMGRKGIGKLSVFSIANLVQISTRRRGSRGESFQMSRDEIKEKIESDNGASDNSATYYPQELNADSIEFEHGTKIVLSDLDRRTSRAEKHLRKRLARRFIVIDSAHNFEVRINDDPIRIDERGFYNDLQFIWTLDDSTRGRLHTFGNIIKHVPYMVGEKDVDIPLLDGTTRTVPFVVSGWLGTTEKPYDIDATNGAVAVFSRGRIVMEDIARDLKEAGVFRQYIVGEVYADFLDEDDAVDLVTSDRQRIMEEDPRYEALRDFLSSILNTIQNNWTAFRRELGVDRAFSNSSFLGEWYDRLSRKHREYARKLIGKIEALPIPDEDAKREIYRASLLAFEKLAITNSLQSIDRLDTNKDFELLRELFDSVDEYEQTQYYQIVSTRLKILESLQRAIRPDLPNKKNRQVEYVVKKHLPDHMWMLDPSWERATASPEMEKDVADIYKQIQLESSNAIIDEGEIRYRYVGGRHVVVEFKPYDRQYQLSEVIEPITDMVNRFAKHLRNSGVDESSPIEFVCIVGWPINAPKVSEILGSIGARAITYQELLSQTERVYSSYLVTQRNTASIVELIEKIAIELSAVRVEGE